MKTGNWNNFRLAKIKFRFSLRNNPYDFATMEEVLLKEEYNLSLNFLPLTIIDGGANIGFTSLFFANKYPDADIVAVEPEAENFALLERNTKPYPRISILKKGIWNSKTNLSLMDEGKGNNAFTVYESDQVIANSIPAVPVNEIMEAKGWKTIDILKLDIEGAEKKVFEKNYESWLPFVKVLIIELHDRMVPGCSETVFKAIEKYNFTKTEKGENLVFFNNLFA